MDFRNEDRQDGKGFGGEPGEDVIREQFPEGGDDGGGWAVFGGGKLDFQDPHGLIVDEFRKPVHQPALTNSCFTFQQDDIYRRILPLGNQPGVFPIPAHQRDLRQSIRNFKEPPRIDRRRIAQAFIGFPEISLPDSGIQS